MTPRLPGGTVTFLFTDIEGSTPLWEREPERMQPALERHYAILQQAVAAHSGALFNTVGDAIQAAFALPADALAAALDAQRELEAAEWPTSAPLRVRMGLHTGPAEPDGADYASTHTLNRVARIMSAAHGGQIVLSVEVAELLHGYLPAHSSLRDLGQHRMKGMTQREHLFQVVAPGLPAGFPPLATLDGFPNNLPVQLTSFVGREREITHLQQLIQPAPAAGLGQRGGGDEVRLLTLTGPGGTGKTRLSLQVAARVLEAFPDGAWLVELAPLADPALVPQSVAATLGVREQPERGLFDVLADYLRAKHLLLILDNCEHLIEACAEAADRLLRAALGIKILASSREALGIAGETTFRVPSLPAPADSTLSLEALGQFEAVRLFVVRAQQVLPSFALTQQNMLAVAQVCRRLDGIPLALELAAARVRLLRVEQIATRLDDRFRLLTGGRRTALPRQQTLRALIDWSYDLLGESERRLFLRLSVFADGWTLEAAEAICAGDGPDAADVLDQLAQLVNKSLVVAEREPGVDTRYRLLETMRQYARDKLLEAGDGSPVRDRHLDYFMRLAEQGERELRQAQQAAWLKRLGDETDNFRAALEWASEGAVEAGVRLASALWWFYLLQGYLAEGSVRLVQLLARPEAGRPTAVRAKGLHAASRLLFQQGAVARCGALAEEALHIYRDLADEAGEAQCLDQMGIAAGSVNHFEASEARLLESLTLYRRVQDPVGLSDVLFDLAARAGGHDLDRARPYLEEALALYRERGDTFYVAFTLEALSTVALHLGDLAVARAYLQERETLQGMPPSVIPFSLAHNLGELALYEGQYAQARAYLEASLRAAQQGHFKVYAAWVISRLGYVALREGDEAQAWAKFKECLSLFQAMGIQIGVVYAVEGLASLRTRQGQLARAAALFAWTDSTREAIHNTRPPVEQAEVNRDLGAIRAQLDDAALSAAAGQGQAMTLEQAVKYALAEGGTDPRQHNSG